MGEGKENRDYHQEQQPGGLPNRHGRLDLQRSRLGGLIGCVVRGDVAGHQAAGNQSPENKEGIQVVQVSTTTDFEADEDAATQKDRQDPRQAKPTQPMHAR